MLETVVISSDDVCCSVVFRSLVCVFVFSVKWFKLIMTYTISCRMWSSVYECQRVECAFTSPVRTECNCDMFRVVNVYLDHLKFCAVCIDGRRYVCCSECNGVSNECNEPTSCIVQPIGTHGSEVMYFWCVCFKGELGFPNCDLHACR